MVDRGVAMDGRLNAERNADRQRDQQARQVLESPAGAT